jgi:hypothetical protein
MADSDFRALWFHIRPSLNSVGSPGASADRLALTAVSQQKGCLERSFFALIQHDFGMK